ncbi:anti-sigma factor domain-containing protein [Kribbella sp. DT2]|uniref:anti-sigma factor domain-containing protein n=1 Tax=Kribbella sp. DT2 TaxID=3393427 RepID=UPI003CE7E147
MTTHLDEELLAQWAFEQVEPDAEAAEHLRTCAECAARLAELRELMVAVDGLPAVEAPPTEVWQRVTAELGLSGESASSSLDARGAGGVPGGWTRRAVALAAGVAVIVGIGIGVGGTLLLGSDDEPQAVVQLNPLAGKTGSGTAGLVDDEQQLKVSASGLAAGGGYYEVWLINEDGKRMVSLGVLAGGHDGTFQLPGDLPAQGYRVVDVSLEPDDGNPAHSLDSVIRGTLPS